MLKPELGVCQTSSHAIGYSLQGQGPKVLLIMGLAMTGEAWYLQVKGLQDSHRLCWFDNRGVGRSGRPSGLYRTAQMAQDALALMDHLGWQSAHIVGVSMGGMIAQELSLASPERVLSLTLIASSAVGLKTRPTGEGVKRWLKVQTASDMDARRRAMGRLLFSDRTLAERPKLMEGMGEELTAGRAEAKVMGAQLHAVFTHNASGRLSALRHLPSQCIVGSGDVLVSPENSRELAALLQCPLHEIPEAGHGVSSEAAELVNQRIRDLILRAQPRGS